MNTVVHKRDVINGELLREFGRTVGICLFVLWIALVALEASVHGPPAVITMYQGIALAIVFASYAIGWKWEALGGVLAVVATTAYVCVTKITTGIFPDPIVLMFAVPGILYLLAWRADQRELQVESSDGDQLR